MTLYQLIEIIKTETIHRPRTTTFLIYSKFFIYGIVSFSVTFFYKLNIIILFFDVFQIMYNNDMKYLIDNEYQASRRPFSRLQSPDFAKTHGVYSLIIF